MRLYPIFTSSLHRWFIVCLVLTVCTGIPGRLAAALVTPEEMNSVRVYKQMAKSTVSGRLSLRQRPSHHAGIGKGTRVWDADR